MSSEECLSRGRYSDDPGILTPNATQILLNDPNLDHEYLPITGLLEFSAGAAKLILGANSPAIAEGRAVRMQTISGTGANHLGALFLSRFYHWDAPKQIYLSNPTWANHHAIFKNVGIQPIDYPYYDPATIRLDFDGFIGTLQIDPTHDQWKHIAEVIVAKNHYTFFDCAYQGFASGDLNNDAWAVRYFIEKGVPMLVCQSFTKNAGLYGEQIGALHIVPPTKDAADHRSEISNPLAYGARLVSLIFNDSALFDDCNHDIKTMADWVHIINQIGMFSFTGINPSQSQALIDTFHIYLTANGQISMAGLNSHNIRYFAESLDKVVRGQV
ncbi:pyridoxal phosphate-dependent transferase [Suillus variegatus]|nr:pyridoxal phosphate-dependent transferase [Suillus variegatus]